jgi:2-polyprenyl-3-methyl-5-hydroxy-6-metoxy-1,4-benzoquinol methylase
MIDTLEIEKYIKNISDIHIFFNHLGRYFYAMKKIEVNKHDVISDASCGQGYGTYNLALRCNKVYGLDINQDFLHYARKRFQSNNIEFLTYEKYFEYNFFSDKIICLETIEHMPLIAIDNFLNNLISTLLPNGKIILSFPIGDNKPSEYNKFHLCEPSIDFMYKILSKYLLKINFEIDSFINSYGYKTDYCFLWGTK